MQRWFAWTLGLSAFLVFWSQPMIARFYLPALGGAAAVWATSLCIFQSLLCFGYLYAHALQTFLNIRGQAAFHIFLWGVIVWQQPALNIPNAPPDAAWPWLAKMLLQHIGPAFFWLSATAPLLQHWFAKANESNPQTNPYKLYVASNVGSFLALLAYPFLLERLWTLPTQAYLWRGSFVAMGPILLSCVWLSLRAMRLHTAPTKAVPIEPSTEEDQASVGAWIFYAAIPSALLVSVTQHITTDIAPAPLLWVLPLALFLATFVWVFSSRPIPWDALQRWQGGLLLPILLLWLSETRMPWWFELPLYLGLFWTSTMLCHAMLAQRRPPPARLTHFYSWMSVGGALGGLFASLVAPLLFAQTWELPLLFLLASFGRFSLSSNLSKLLRPEKNRLLLWFVLCFLLSPLGFLFQDPRIALQWAIGCILLLFAPLGGLLFRWLSVRLVVGFLAIFLCLGTWALRSPSILLQKRGFFGPMRVIKTPQQDAYLFLHGRTLHGLQRLQSHKPTSQPQTPTSRNIRNHRPSLTRQVPTSRTLRPHRSISTPSSSPTAWTHPTPLAYFSPQSPLGQLFQSIRHAPSRKVCVFGLGIGTIAAYGRPQDQMIFYEIDPLVAQIAKDTRYFHYLSQAKATLAIHILDARAGIRQVEDHSLDILIQDAFSSDAIPFHLLTAEAFALYARKLKPKGIWVFHITNHFIDLEPALAEQFASMGMIARIQAHQPPAKQRFHFPSRWVVATKAHAPLASLWKDSRWRPLQRRRGFQLWTDQRSSLLSVLQYPWSKSYKKRAHKKKTK